MSELVFVNRQGIKAAFYLVFRFEILSHHETGVSSFSLCAGREGFFPTMLDSHFIAVCGIF